MGIRLIIALERGILREGLSSLFLSQQDMQIVGETDDFLGLLEVAEKSPADVIVMSLKLPGMNGFDVVSKVLAANSTSRIIALAADLDIHHVRQFLSSGGAGYITSVNGFPEFVRAVRTVLTKRTYLSPDVADAMVANYVLTPPPDRPAGGQTALSLREREVLQLVADGMSTKDAAAALKISTKTVDMHRQRIMNKLKLHSVAQLTKYAIREGIAALH